MTLLSRPRQANPRASGSLGAGTRGASQQAGLVTSLFCDKRPAPTTTQLPVSVVSRVS